MSKYATKPDDCQTNQANECTTGERVSILDRLKSMKARLAADYKKKIQKLDRQINLLESSGAEEIVLEAAGILVDLTED